MKPPLWATLMTILGFGILCALGTWQLQRLEWKENLIAQINDAYKDKARIPAPGFVQITPNKALKRIRIKGRFEHDKELKIKPRTYEGKVGYHLLTPFHLSGGGTILVNRGWVPDKDVSIKRPQGDGYVTGLLREPPRANPFTPANNPDKEEWYLADLEQIKLARNIKKLAPLILYEDSGRKTYPLAKALKWEPRNDHLQYAIFWFTMAGLLLIIYYLRFLRKKN